jgi:sugar/nucleoside kinase (ribokinase family)
MVCQPIETIPPAGALIKTDRIEFSIGGCSANMAVDMERLGLKIGLSGRVGQDLFGREIRDRLAAARVDTSRLEMSSTSPTSTTFVLNVKDQDRRFIHCVGANGEYDGREVTEAAIRNARSIFVGGYCLMESLTPERAIRLFELARDAGAMTALNVVLPEGTKTIDWLPSVLPWTDYFFCNNDEAERITDQSDPLRQAEALRTMGAKTAIVTRGECGAILIGPNDRLRVGVYSVKPMDGTGTGDAFASGILYGLLRGHSVAKALTFGTAMGASCVRSMGATTGVFNAKELSEFVRDNQLAIESI